MPIAFVSYIYRNLPETPAEFLKTITNHYKNDSGNFIWYLTDLPGMSIFKIRPRVKYKIYFPLELNANYIE